ncbi:MAG: peptidoglycan recognition protein family protein, partial [Dehalococcoidia bacterium]
DAAPARAGMRPHSIERVTLHHTGPPAWYGVPSADAYLRGIQRFHMGPERGWPDIAYHLLIDLDGGVWEGRSLAFAGDTATAYDPSGHALVAVLGDYDQQQPSVAQIEAIVQTVRWVTETYGLDDGTPAGHRDYAATACPGQNLYRLLDDLRARL